MKSSRLLLPHARSFTFGGRACLRCRVIFANISRIPEFKKALKSFGGMRNG